jgi:molybdenum ABC transporter molybdate-binding protein
MTALVAANMTEAFGRVEEVYEKRNPDAGIKASYAGTQVLFTQLQQGVPADLFIAADREYAERAKSQGLIEEFTPVAHMKPVVVVPEENPAGVESLRDLGESDLELVVGVENVPVGKYTRQVFRNAEAEYGAGFFDAVMDNVVSMETNTKQVTQKAATGAADAAVVYRTDVTPSVAEKVEIVEIPEAINAAATNYAAVKADADNPQLARRVIAFLRSPAAQDVVASFDYTRIESDR